MNWSEMLTCVLSHFYLHNNLSPRPTSYFLYLADTWAFDSVSDLTEHIHSPNCTLPLDWLLNDQLDVIMQTYPRFRNTLRCKAVLWLDDLRTKSTLVVVDRALIPRLIVYIIVKHRKHAAVFA